eukprot:1144581-Pelagomonas_calceolata.AAC.5
MAPLLAWSGMHFRRGKRCQGAYCAASYMCKTITITYQCVGAAWAGTPFKRGNRRHGAPCAASLLMGGIVSWACAEKEYPGTET